MKSFHEKFGQIPIVSDPESAWESVCTWKLMYSPWNLKLMKQCRLLSQYTPALMDVALARDFKLFGINQTRWSLCSFRRVS